MFAQSVDERLRAPQKHSAVPEIPPRRNEFSRFFGIWFFREAAYTQRIALKQSARLDVTVPGLRPIWPDAKHDNIRAGCGNLNPALERLAITFLIANDVVGGKQPKDGAGILAQQQKRAQPDGRRRVSSNGLRQDLRPWQLGKLLPDRGLQIRIGDNPKLLCRGQW